MSMLFLDEYPHVLGVETSAKGIGHGDLDLSTSREDIGRGTHGFDDCGGVGAAVEKSGYHHVTGDTGCSGVQDKDAF
jgi:hypothetical protein